MQMWWLLPMVARDAVGGSQYRRVATPSKTDHLIVLLLSLCPAVLTPHSSHSCWYKAHGAVSAPAWDPGPAAGQCRCPQPAPAPPRPRAGHAPPDWRGASQHWTRWPAVTWPSLGWTWCWENKNNAAGSGDLFSPSPHHRTWTLSPSHNQHYHWMNINFLCLDSDWWLT